MQEGQGVFELEWEKFCRLEILFDVQRVGRRHGVLALVDVVTQAAVGSCRNQLEFKSFLQIRQPSDVFAPAAIVRNDDFSKTTVEFPENGQQPFQRKTAVVVGNQQRDLRKNE